MVSKTVARSYSTALWLYDLTGGWRIGERHREVDKEEALAHLPTLNTDHLVAGFLYFDARADDARLTLTLARTAALEFGAAVANYTPVVRHDQGADGDADGAVVRPVDGRRRRRSSPSGPRWWSTPPACGPTRSARSTRAPTPTPSGRPRACTSPCRPTACPATSRR